MALPAPESRSNPTGGAERVTEWKGYRLLGFQIQAIDALRAGDNVLVSAPTGAGKTLVAEYAIADAVARGRRCVYTAPIKALSNQKYRDFRDDPGIDVGLMTGDVTIRAEAQVLIMTTEILRNAILEDPGGLHDVDYVILDEVHFMDDPERGSVWEEALIFAPPEIRFIALSATIANLDQLGAWLREIRPQGLRVIESRRRPVPLKHRLHEDALGVFAPERLDWARGRVAHRPREERPAPGGRDRRRGRDGRRWPDGRRRREPRTLRTLFDELAEDDLLPALVFSFSRRDCERLAHASRNRRLLDAEETRRMAALQEELVRIFQLRAADLDAEVFRLASRGVGFHHAGMLPIHKEVVERMFTSGLLKLLFTTETFALGINMPARTVVFAGLRKFDGVNFDYLRTREYLQMAGRAGRQGLDREGLVVSTLEARDLAEAPLERMLRGKPEPIRSRFRLSYSSILHLYGARGRDGVHEAWEKSFNRYQHRSGGRKARERNQRLQRRVVDDHLALLAELGYIEPGGGLTPRGEIGRLLYGYELQLTEMLFRGVLEPLGPRALAVLFVGLVYEDRRRGGPRGQRGRGGERGRARRDGGMQRRVDELVRELLALETRFGIPAPLKAPDWGLTEATETWWRGAPFEDLERVTGLPPGDVCRSLRMALQLLRQVRRAIGPHDDLAERLDAAIDGMNREEVDARRQLELG